MIPRRPFQFIAFLYLFGLAGCTDAMLQKLSPQAVAIGTLNQLTVIADTDVWEGEIGDSIGFYYGSAFPLLPQPEPLFDLKYFSPEDILGEPLRRELKAYMILADISDEDSPTRKFVIKELGEASVQRAVDDSEFTNVLRKDMWAEGQILIFLFSNGRSDLLREVIDRFPAIAQKVQEHYMPQIDASVYLAGQNNKVTQTIQDSLRLQIKVPGDYFIAYSQNKIIWLRKETDVLSSNIILHRLAYRNQNQFSKDSIVALRDALGRLLVRTDIQGTFMKTNDVDLPVFIQQIRLSDSYTTEIRGIWEIVGDYMGGPFISYLMLDEKNGELVFIDTFVHAPGEEKRNFMLHLEHIVSSVRI